MTQELLTTLLPIAVLLAIRLWNSGLVQSAVGRWTPKLPKWAQPIPPLVLSVGATVVVWMVQGVSDATLTDTLMQGGSTGLVTIGLWHVSKRAIPAIAIDQIKKAAARGGLTVLLVLVLLGGSQGCSGGQPQPLVCPVPSSLLAAAPALASAAKQAPGVVQDVQEVVADPTVSGVVRAIQGVLELVAPLCLSSASEACQDTVDAARAQLGEEEVSRQKACSLVEPLASLVPAEQAPAELAVARELCR
jgi:hypothetical protein